MGNSFGCGSSPSTQQDKELDQYLEQFHKDPRSKAKLESKDLEIKLSFPIQAI